jgi:hypothetical protein
VLPKPSDKVTAAQPAGGEVQHELLLFIHSRRDVGAVEEKERRHRSVGNALITILRVG